MHTHPPTHIDTVSEESEENDVMPLAPAVLRFSGSTHLFILWLSGYSFIQA